MNRLFLWIAIVLATSVQTATAGLATSSLVELKPQQQQARAASLATQVLTQYHYKAVPLDDSMSERIFDNYLKALDPDRQFFLQADIDQLSRYRTSLDDAIAGEDLSAPFAIFNRFTQRVSEQFAYARSLLTREFDFASEESYVRDRAESAWPANESEVNDLWQKRVKNDWLGLKLAGKDDASIREFLGKRYDGALKRIGKIQSADAFQSFMNAYTMAIEPHTNYMGSRAAEDFNISRRLSLVGIGAILVEKEDCATIRELVPGSPAALSGQLKVGDRIVGVAQGERSPITDVFGWRIDDTVDLIRGEADSVVVLEVIPAGAGLHGKRRLVSIIRKKISLDDQAARKSIVPVAANGKTFRLGVIALPSFYTDFEAQQKGDSEYRSATRDVARLLGELKEDEVDGVLIDLRNNGGGSLGEVIELTGLFIGKGPVVQRREAGGKISVEENTRAEAMWTGPLAVLINQASASASEIFAAAIQDYGRGPVVGEGSFGKGTIQAMVSLDRIAKNAEPTFGELKMTVAQFFRLNGGATQVRGVIPDILFPSAADKESHCEANLDNALPWEQIQAADYAPSGNLKPRIPTLQARHDARVKNDQDYIALQQEIAEIKRQRERHHVSLNESDRRHEQEAARKLQMKGDDGLQAGERTLASELATEEARKASKDVLLAEAVNILGDEVELLRQVGAGNQLTALSGANNAPQQ
ncbi:MAG: carboxy terminal-processing peptidase [Propionivibrio sp.]|nr:carboxy terminal-processing peptidase [Propionivibrio sp.]MBP6709723.1 carboxy terminal-processing peptidase [Propionivibrio sp.]MBP7524143.1 carboxy terminal-processing peptidase [Propionivibrio sp.]